MKGLQKARENITSSILSLPCKSHLKPLVVKQILWEEYLKSFIKPYPQQNKKFYNLQQVAHNELSTFDLSTSKIWYAIFLLSKQDFTSALKTVNNVLSSIPPFYLCISNHDPYKRREAEQLYAEKFMNSGLTVMERAREAWLTPLRFHKYMMDVVPLAIQIELYFSDNFLSTPVCVKSFVMLYYLAFQCYHELGQYNRRNNALRQLVDVLMVKCPTCDKFDYHLLNIAGHCLLVAGDKDQARHMFTLSCQLTEGVDNYFSRKGTAATWYLHHFC